MPASSPARVDLYRLVHKGLRALLFDLSTAAARADLAEEAAVSNLVRRFDRALGLVAEHSENEDRETMPALERASPEVARRLAADHVRLDALAEEVSAIVRRLPGLSPGERIANAPALCARTNRLVAEHLVHMDVEETDANAALWAAYGDAELLAINGRILAAIPPDRMETWREVMIPNLTPQERVFLRGETS